MKDYITRAPRAIKGKWVNGSIKRSVDEEASEAFSFFCRELQRGTELECARKRTETKFNISLTVEECKPNPFSREKSTYEVRVG